jgi:hypothetical protein
MSTSIFFTVKRPDGNPNAEPTVVASIYSYKTGRKLAEHVMTLEGAVIRMHDLKAAIADCRERREADLKFGAPI